MSVIDPIKFVVNTGLNKTINQCLQFDPDTKAKVAELDGKIIRIELRILNLSFYLLPNADGLHVSDSIDREPDTTLTGTPLALMRAGLARNKQAVLFGGDVEITGDTETGQKIKDILDGIDIDWEEQLSMVVGDIAAHQIGNIARGLKGWTEETAETLAQDISEYLQEETRLLPTRPEVDTFLSTVDEIRADTERLGLRVNRLQQRLDQATGQTSKGESE